jgi:DNA-binding winged helix-turn-helix (wHTH) protein
MASGLPIIFDRFKLDPASGELYGDGSAISLTPKPLSVLQYLAARPGHLILKSELLNAHVRAPASGA